MDAFWKVKATIKNRTKLELTSIMSSFYIKFIPCEKIFGVCVFECAAWNRVSERISKQVKQRKERRVE